MDLLSQPLDWSVMGSNALHIVIALVLALPLGWNRERAERLGIRMIPLVAVAACGYVLLGVSVIGQSSDGMARLLQGLMTGVGFLGGGAIVKEGMTVRGTSTAASIWNTAAIGAGTALGRYEVAVLLSVINLAILIVLHEVGKEVDGGEELDSEANEERAKKR